jgi:predicted DNA-binding ArsR family transcriptional regulator
MVPSENTSIAANRSTQASEVEKWKKFGYLMAESYDELKKENEKIKQEMEKDKNIIFALKDQVDKLRQIIRATRGGNADYDPLE